MCRVKRPKAPNWVDDSVATKPGYALEYQGDLLYRLMQHHWGPGNLCFHQVFRAQSAASFAPLLPGEHSETGISVHQLIIKLGFFQLRQFQPVDPLRGKAFQDFLSSTKVNLLWNKANYISPKWFFSLGCLFSSFNLNKKAMSIYFA